MGCRGLWVQQDNEYLCSSVAAFGWQEGHTPTHCPERDLGAGQGGGYERLGGRTDRDGYGPPTG